VGPTLFFDHATLATARSGQKKNDKGKGFDKFVNTLYSNKSAINRILLTSGSTGTPKAVPLTNGVVIARYELGVQQLPLSPDDKVLWSLGYDTAGGFNGPIEALLTGATVLLHLQKSGPETFGVLLRRSTRFTTVPSILALIMERIADPLEGADKRIVLTTGSRLEPKLAERCRQIVGSDLRSFYGSTEVGAVSEIVGEQIQEEAGNVGKLYPGVEVEFDAGTGEQRAPGLLRFKSPWMAPGYWKEGRIEPFEDGWFSPGDMGYLNDNGELIVAGRNDDVLNYNGEKFDAVATESRIKALAEIEDAFVTVVSLRSRDWLVVMAVSQLEPQVLKERLATVLTRTPFNMLKVPQIPRNHMGKLERVRLTDYCQRQLGEYLDRA
jgi:long-chain acyl-CoA synthetase